MTVSSTAFTARGMTRPAWFKQGLMATLAVALMGASLSAEARSVAIRALRAEFGQGTRGRDLLDLTEFQRSEYERRVVAIDEEWPPVDVGMFVDHIDYAVELMGIDYVGISSDFDGGGGVSGWRDAGETMNVTLELVQRGYSEVEIAKLWGGNLLRVMREVERVATEM